MGLDLFAALRARRPRLRGLLAVLRRRATWRTVWRFVWLGPLAGVLPLTLLNALSGLLQPADPAAISTGFRDAGEFAFFLSFTYLMGGPPALVAGLLFATWYHGTDRPPVWPRRVALGALAGLGATAAGALAGLLVSPLLKSATAAGPFWLAYAAVIACLGIPAAVLLALLQRAAPVTQAPARPPPGNPEDPVA